MHIYYLFLIKYDLVTLFQLILKTFAIQRKEGGTGRNIVISPLPACFPPEALFLRRHDLQPVAVRIRDKIDSHSRIFKHNTAHLLMKRMSRLIILCPECQMKFTLSQVVSLRMFL